MRAFFSGLVFARDVVNMLLVLWLENDLFTYPSRKEVMVVIDQCCQLYLLNDQMGKLFYRYLSFPYVGTSNHPKQTNVCPFTVAAGVKT